MKYLGNDVIAARRNSHGVLVYIPETLRLGGILYTQAYRFGNSALSRTNPKMIYSKDESVTMTLAWETRTVTISSPFSRKMLIDALTGT